MLQETLFQFARDFKLWWAFTNRAGWYDQQNIFQYFDIFAIMIFLKIYIMKIIIIIIRLLVLTSSCAFKRGECQ